MFPSKLNGFFTSCMTIQEENLNVENLVTDKSTIGTTS